MKIWVDADACPVMIKEVLYRVADRRKIEITFVANQFMRLPKSDYINLIVVDAGFDVADERIVDEVAKNDVVVTADLPLANDVFLKGAIAMTPRGEIFTADNIAAKLSARNIMTELRSMGIETKGPRPMNDLDRQNFTNALERTLVRLSKK